MRRKHQITLSILLVVILLEFSFLAKDYITTNEGGDNNLAAVISGVLTTLTNEQRIANNLPTLSPNELLEKAAQMQADDMATKGYFAHTSPDGKSPWYWLELAGYEYSYAGENLAVNFFESEDVAKAWMNSPKHKSNIIKKNFTEIGIATSTGMYKGKNAVFVVQFFGTPIK